MLRKRRIRRNIIIIGILLATAAGIAAWQLWGGPQPIHMSHTTSIAAGDYHSLVVTGEGRVYGFGRNRYAQLAQPNRGMYFEPVFMIDNAVGVAAGSNHSLVLRPDGTALIVGDNRRDQLANTRVSLWTSQFSIVEQRVTHIGASQDFSFAINSESNLVMWGNNGWMQLGRARPDNHRRISWEGVQAAASGDHHTIVITEEGGLVVWGHNRYGQLGTGDLRMRYVAAEITVPGREGLMFAYVAAANTSTFAIDENNNLWAWGNNAYGQLGDGTREDRHLPVQIMADVVSVIAGRYHTLAITHSGEIYAWGRNHHGQLGLGFRTDEVIIDEDELEEGEVMPVEDAVATPTRITLGNVAFAAAGSHHTLVVTAEGRLYSFGSNAFGQLGIPGIDYALTPIFVMDNILLASSDE
ncbi:MAG: hypothetical protein FWC95_08410 [Defluviitaleaceae bacterium]|nr:hypothetical protein [Defluviitaleaceae bacterium]